MIVNKKGRMTLTVIALSMLLPATAFAAASQPQPETWGQTFGRWGNNALSTGLAYIPAAAGAYYGGLDGYITGSNLITLPLLHNMQYNKRIKQHETGTRGSTCWYSAPMIANFALTAAAIPFIYGKEGSLDKIMALGGSTIGAYILSTLLFRSSFANRIDQEQQRDKFIENRNKFQEYIYNIINEKDDFNPETLNEFIRRYNDLQKDLRSSLKFDYLSAPAFIEVTIIDALITRKIITLEKGTHLNIVKIPNQNNNPEEYRFMQNILNTFGIATINKDVIQYISYGDKENVLKHYLGSKLKI